MAVFLPEPDSALLDIPRVQTPAFHRRDSLSEGSLGL